MSMTQLPGPYAGRPLQFAEAFAPQPDSDSFNFRKTMLSIVRSIRAHRLLIAVTCLLTVAITEVYIIVWPPIYVAEVMLVAESDKDQSRDEFYRYWQMFRKDRLNDEVLLFTAPTVLAKVIDRLHLSYDDVYHSFFSYATYLWTSSWPGRHYRLAKEWFFPPRRGPYDPTKEQIDAARTLTEFKTGVGVEALSDSDVGKLVVRGPTSRVAEVANTLTAVYLQQRIDRHREEAQKDYDALSVEVAKTRVELQDLESRMEKYDVDNSVLMSMEKDKLDITRWSVLLASIQDIKTSINTSGDTLANINAQLATEQKDVVSARLMKASSIRETLNDKLAQLNLARRQMLIHYRPDAPEVKELESQIAAVTQQLAREPVDQVAQTTVMLSDGYQALLRRKSQLEAELAGDKAALASKQAEAEQMGATVREIPEKIKTNHDLEREHALLEKRYVVMSEKLTEADITRTMAATGPATIQIVEPATAPGEPVWPRTKLLLAAAAGVGLLAGLGMALLVDLLSGRVDRYRLASGETGLQLYAILSPDNLFAAQFFPLLSGPTKDSS